MQLIDGAALQCRQWLALEGRKSVWLANQLDVDATLVSHWLAGRRQPSAAMAEEIERLSWGQVEAMAWNCATISSEP